MQCFITKQNSETLILGSSSKLHYLYLSLVHTETYSAAIFSIIDERWDDELGFRLVQ